MPNIKYYQPDEDTLIANSLPANSVWLDKESCELQFSNPNTIVIEFLDEDIPSPSFVGVPSFNLSFELLNEVYLFNRVPGFINKDDETGFLFFNSLEEFDSNLDELSDYVRDNFFLSSSASELLSLTDTLDNSFVRGNFILSV